MTDRRDRHRQRAWQDSDTDRCPRCGRSFDTAERADVHHQDENAQNGDPSNLRKRCQRCHLGDEHDRDVNRDPRPRPSRSGPPTPSTGPR